MQVASARSETHPINATSADLVNGAACNLRHAAMQRR
jgi:hypothetical protein